MSIQQSDEPQPDYDQSIKFLHCLGGVPHLAAISPDGGAIEGKTFLGTNPDGSRKTGKEKTGEIREWIESRNRTKNVYWTTGVVRRDFNGAKPKDTDIVTARMLKVDLDPLPVPPDWTGTAKEWVDKERELILTTLTNDLPEGVPGKPTIVLDSGSGLWGLWIFGLPYDGLEAEEAAHLRACGEHLIELYRAVLGKDRVDGVADLSRICRLPGTVNHPGERKVKKGRIATLATVIEKESKLVRRYGPVQFEPPEGMATSKQAAGIRKAPKPSGVTVIGDLHAELPSDVSDLCKVAIAQGFDPETPSRFDGPQTPDGAPCGEPGTNGSITGTGWTGDRSKAVYFVCCELVRSGVDDDAIRALLLDDRWGISDHVLDQSNPKVYADRQIDRAREEVGAIEKSLILDPGDPLPSARIYVARQAPHLLYYNGDWLDYNGAAYAEIESNVLRSRLFLFLAKAKCLKLKGQNQLEEVPFKPTRAKVSEVCSALEAITIRPRDVYAPPCWIGKPGLPPREIISCANGLLHLPTGELMAPSPSYFTRNALDIGYEPSASKPARWLRFLDDLWARDPESIEVLQEIMGYVLVPDTSLQKVFLLIGPARSGKGTIGRVLRQLVGTSNVGGSTMKSLGGEFGLESLIGKQLAIISDMRLGKKSDPAAIAENLLRISGEDLVDANRKNKTFWTGTLAVRFLIMTNELPRFDDASGALASRFVPLVMTESFLNREDPNLNDKILPELPGILNWAIEGWRRLQGRGHFVLPGTSRETIQSLADLASPVSGFVRDRCVLNSEDSVAKDELYPVYRAWSYEQGQVPETKDVFSRNLLAATRVQAKKGPRPERIPMFFGIRLVPTTDEETFG